MKKISRTIVFVRRSYLLLLCFSLLATGCSKGYKNYFNEDNTKGGFIYDRLKSNPEFSPFLRALDYQEVKR